MGSTLLGLAQIFPGLALGHALLGLPYMIRVLAASFSAIPQDVIDAAENLGAGMIFVFVTSLEEFNLTFVIGTPSFQTIPTILYSFLGYNFVHTNASVVALLLMVSNIVVLFLVERFIKSDYLSSALGKMRGGNPARALQDKGGRVWNTDILRFSPIEA